MLTEMIIKYYIIINFLGRRGENPIFPPPPFMKPWVYIYMYNMGVHFNLYMFVYSIEHFIDTCSFILFKWNYNLQK